MTATSSDYAPRFRARAIYDPDTERYQVVVDARSATLEDCRVTANSRTIRVRIDGPTPWTRAFSPPSDQTAFGDDRRAVYNNGILTVAVGTVAASRDRRV